MDSAGERSYSSGGTYVIERRRTAIRLWLRANGKFFGEFADQSEGGDGPLVSHTCIATSPDDRRLACVLDGRKIVVWNLDNLTWRYHPCWHGYRPDWVLSDVKSSSPIKQLTFLWGGALICAITEERELLVLRFWHASAVLARIGLEEETTQLVATAYGDRIFCLGLSGRLVQFRFSYLPSPELTQLRTDVLSVRFRRADAKTVAVAGDFTGWQPHPLKQHSDGIWLAHFELAAGVHEYKLLVDGHEWVLDPHIPFRPGDVAQNNYVSVTSQRPN